MYGNLIMQSSLVVVYAFIRNGSKGAIELALIYKNHFLPIFSNHFRDFFICCFSDIIYGICCFIPINFVLCILPTQKYSILATLFSL